MPPSGLPDSTETHMGVIRAMTLPATRCEPQFGTRQPHQDFDQRHAPTPPGLRSTLTTYAGGTADQPSFTDAPHREEPRICKPERQTDTTKPTDESPKLRSNGRYTPSPNQAADPFQSSAVTGLRRTFATSRPISQDSTFAAIQHCATATSQPT
jgi:hypothetical protein